MNTQTVIENNQAASSPLKTITRDPVFLAMLVLLVGLLLVDSAQFNISFIQTIVSLLNMLPYFALAIGIAAYAKATGADALIARAFSGHPLRATLLAALAGSQPNPPAPTRAFWIASPIMDPEMFVLTAAGIGLNFAIAKTLAAMVMGLFAGSSVLILQRFGFLSSPLQQAVFSSCGSCCDTASGPGLNWKFWQDKDRIITFRQEAGSIGVFLGKWLTLAFFLETLMIAYISSEWISAYAGNDNPFAIPLAAAVGAPSYLNGYAAIPLISGLVSIGMTPGAAMAFATAGAVSSIPAAIAVYALVKKPVFLLYLCLGLIGAMLTAWVYQLSGIGL